jgi:phenylalanyl-tRNA synthetase beta chain
LDQRDLLICVKDGAETRPAGLAGVMGGADDEIRAGTTEVALEVAHFDPVSVRLSARRQGLKTEASYRFERGVDWDGQLRAGKRFLELAQQWAGAEVSSQQLDLNHVELPKPIVFRPEYTNRLVGFETPVSADQQVKILQGLGCRVTAKVEGQQYLVSAPSHRIADLHIEEDLVEEVARVIGYDKLPSTLPAFFPAPDNIGVEADYLAKERLKAVLEGLGFQEVVNYSWTHPAELAACRAPLPLVEFVNPQSSDQTHLRTALYPGLLHNLQVNLAQGESGPFLLFEVGNTFHAREATKVGLLLCGDSVKGGWQAGLGGGFYALKGLLEAAAQQLGARVKVVVGSSAHLHPGVSGTVVWNGHAVGSIGQIHPAIAAAKELPIAYLAELDFPLPAAQLPFRDIARFPASLRDVAVMVPEAVTYSAVEELIRSHGGEWLESLEVFDIYRGKPLDEGHKSLAFHLTFRHQGRTLTDTETDGFMQSVIGAVERAGYAVRK